MAFNIMDAIKNRDQIAPPQAKQDGRIKIQYISVKNIVPAQDKRNYYSTEAIETLKSSIAVHGIKQNLLVKAIDGGKYELIAGERRWRASSALYSEGRADCEFVPCAVERPIDDLDQRLLLTTTNSTARELSDYEKGLQVQEMNDILDEYERRGVTIEGPRRELIQKHFGLSSGQVARYTAIHNNLSAAFMREYVQREITVSVAYELSRLPEDKQTEAYRIYEEQGGLSIKDVKAFQNTEEPQKQSSPEVTTVQMGEAEGKVDSAPTNTDADHWDEYGRMKASKYCRQQRYREHDKTIDINDNRLPEGGFRLYLVQDKEDGLWRSSAAEGFIEAGGGRWPHRDADNPINSEIYPAFQTMEEALKYAGGKMFWHCNAAQKEILKSWGYKDPAEQEQQQVPRFTALEREQAKIDEWNRQTQEQQQTAKESEELAEQETEAACLIIEGDARPRSGKEAQPEKRAEEVAEPGLLKIEAAKFTMGVLEREIEKCGIEIRYAKEQGKTAKGALAAAKLEYLGRVLSKVQADLFEMTGDDIFKETD